MHSSRSMTSMRSPSWMQSTGQTSTQERSLMSMQRSEMMYVKARLLYRGQQLLDEGRSALHKRRFGEHLVEPGGVRGAQAGRVLVVREPDNRNVRIGVHDLFRVDPRHV